MKKIILVSLLIAIANFSFSQTLPPNVKTKEFYLAKSHKQRTFGWVMLGGGALLTGIGFAAATAEALDNIQGGTESNNTGSTIAGIGIVSMLGSIPVFIISSKNKRKAAALAFNMQKVPILYTTINRTLHQPVLSLIVSL